MPNVMNPETLDILQYNDRQFIVVSPDEVVEEVITKAALKAAKKAEQAETPATSSSTHFDWKSIATGAVIGVSSAFTKFSPLYTVGALVINEALEAWARARESGLNILQVKRSDASKLKFPPGHPRDGVLYIGHPVFLKQYYTAGAFHRMAFEHKFSEAIDILMHLGAKEIIVEHLRGWSREFAGNLSLPLARAGTGIKTSSNTNLLFEATLKGNTNPTMPDTLVWYQHEPTWQSIAKGRLSYGLSQFSLTVNYEDDFGVNLDLKTSVEKAGLKLGGNFETFISTTWKIHGRFADFESDKQLE